MFLASVPCACACVCVLSQHDLAILERRKGLPPSLRPSLRFNLLHISALSICRRFVIRVACMCVYVCIECRMVHKEGEWKTNYSEIELTLRNPAVFSFADKREEKKIEKMFCLRICVCNGTSSCTVVCVCVYGCTCVQVVSIRWRE